MIWHPCKIQKQQPCFIWKNGLMKKLKSTCFFFKSDIYLFVLIRKPFLELSDHGFLLFPVGFIPLAVFCFIGILSVTKEKVWIQSFKLFIKDFFWFVRKHQWGNRHLMYIKMELIVFESLTVCRKSWGLILMNIQNPKKCKEVFLHTPKPT